MKILIAILIVHIICSVIAKISINWVFDILKNKGIKLINTGRGDEVDKKMSDFSKNFIPHVPVLNIFISLMTIKLYLSSFFKPKN